MRKIGLVIILIILFSGMSFAAFDKKVTYPGKTLAPVTFDHGSHLKQKNIACKTCHPSIFAKMKAGVNKITMDDINKGKFCAVCHKDGGKAFAIKTNCAKCHVKAKG